MNAEVPHEGPEGRMPPSLALSGDFVPAVTSMVLQNNPENLREETKSFTAAVSALLTGKPGEKFRINGHSKEIIERINSKREWGDLASFFGEEKERKYFVFIDGDINTNKQDSQLHDYVLMTERVKGKQIVYVFDYPKDHYFASLKGEDGKKIEVPFLSLRLAASIKGNHSEVIYNSSDQSDFKVGLMQDSPDLPFEGCMTPTHMCFSDIKKRTLQMSVSGGNTQEMPFGSFHDALATYLPMVNDLETLRQLEAEFSTASRINEFICNPRPDTLQTYWKVLSGLYNQISNAPGNYLRNLVRKLTPEIKTLLPQSI